MRRRNLYSENFNYCIISFISEGLRPKRVGGLLDVNNVSENTHAPLQGVPKRKWPFVYLMLFSPKFALPINSWRIDRIITTDCDFGILRTLNDREFYNSEIPQCIDVVNLLETKLHKHQGETLQ